LSSRCLWHDPITGPEEFYRLWCAKNEAALARVELLRLRRRRRRRRRKRGGNKEEHTSMVCSNQKFY
jgi:hypothetical protein